MKLGRISGHARQRMKQLGLDETALRGLLEQGCAIRDAAGGMRVFDRQAAAPHRTQTGGFYAVLDAEGEVITVGNASAVRH